VRPKRGLAAFFSYRGADGIMDDGLTEHSACPVLEGEKWVTVFWMRIGVSAERPWTMFDPQGIPVLNADPASGQSDDFKEDNISDAEADEEGSCANDSA